MSIVLQPKSVAYANEQLGKKLDSAFTKIEQDADHIRLIAARQEQIGEFKEDSEAIVNISPGFLELFSSSDIVLSGSHIKLDADTNVQNGFIEVLSSKDIKIKAENITLSGDTVIEDSFSLKVGKMAGWTISSKMLSSNNGAAIISYESSASGYTPAMRILNGKAIFGKFNSESGEDFTQSYGYTDISTDGIYGGSPKASASPINRLFSFDTSTANIELCPVTLNVFASEKVLFKAPTYVSGNNLYIDDDYYIMSSAGYTPKRSIVGRSSSGNVYLGMYYYGSSHHPEATSNIYLSASTTQALGTFKTSDGTIVSSDKRFKKDIEDMTEKEVEFVLGLVPKKYKLVSGTSDRYHYGFIAQDVDTLMDFTIGDVGLLTKGEVKPKEDEDYLPIDFENDETYRYGLRYEEFIAPIIKTIQYQQQEIEKLKTQLALCKN